MGKDEIMLDTGFPTLMNCFLHSRFFDSSVKLFYYFVFLSCLSCTSVSSIAGNSMNVF